jgi:ubiquinone/menaquinone biosynthesis C-methylase UbiE
MPESIDGAIGSVRATYDKVARAYHEQLGNELDAKPLDRALLNSFVELVDGGPIADVGCGPGHVTRYLGDRHADVIGIDVSQAMIDTAREQAPDVTFSVASMLELPVGDDAWAGAIALYSMIHLTAAQRALAFRELARTIHVDGWLLVAFHVDSPECAAGEVHRLTSWLGEAVDIATHFLEPGEVIREVEKAGFVVMANMLRRPLSAIEYPSRRCYLLAQRRSDTSLRARGYVLG